MRAAIPWVAPLLLLVALSASLKADEPARVVIAYYDPDANHHSIPEITNSFNRYLRSKGVPVVLQAVLRQAALEDLIEESQTAFVMVPSSYLTDDRLEDLTPLLVPTADGSSSYRKTLVDNGDGEAGALDGAVIAATIPGEDSSAGVSATLELIQGEGVSTNDASILPVSKDIDALLALSFGQVQAALVTRESIEVMESLNPTAAAQLRVVFRTSSILRPPLCRIDGHGTDAVQAQLLEALGEMADDRLGRRVLFRMGLGGWTSFESEMLP